MKCPQCGYPQHCPCKSCVDRLPLGMKPWVAEGDFISCGNCGFIGHVDWWETEAMRQFKKENTMDISKANTTVALESRVYVIGYEGVHAKVIISRDYRVTIQNHKGNCEFVFMNSKPEMAHKIAVILQRAYKLVEELKGDSPFEVTT